MNAYEILIGKKKKDDNAYNNINSNESKSNNINKNNVKFDIKPKNKKLKLIGTLLPNQSSNNKQKKEYKKKNLLGPIKDNKVEYKKGVYDKTNDIINKSINNQLNEYKIKIFEHQQDINSNKLSSQEIGKRRNLIKKYEEKIEKLEKSNYNFDDLDIKLKINEQ